MVDRDRESSKVRVCLDAKSKHFGMSLNDAFLKGKHELNDTYQVLTKFRCGVYASVGDIRKMFWQIQIHEEDQRYHGVVYKSGTYVFTRVGFGNKPSPPIADRAMLKIAAYGRDSQTLGSQALLYNRFVDDIMNASSNVEILKETMKQVDELLGKFGFDIKEWFSNNESIGSMVNVRKVLGIAWNMKDDILMPVIEKAPRRLLTKRNVLSRIAEVWDPLGLCSGVHLLGKLLFQSIVRLQFKWDKVIENADLNEKWKTWTRDLENCDRTITSRSILPSTKCTEKMVPELVGFSDGSEVGYGCVLYIRWKNSDESVVDIKFLGAKAKVASIKGNTIPRNELNGAVILTRLAWSALEAFKRTELGSLFVENEIRLNTDSTAVLAWIQAPAINFKPYVKNKVIEVKTLLPSSVWRYVPSTKNKAADLLSKGCGTTDLDVIIKGPDILKRRTAEWPEPPTKRKAGGDAELLETVNSTAIARVDPLFNIDKFESWKKVVRITAYVKKFIHIIRRKLKTRSVTLISDEIYEETLVNPSHNLDYVCTTIS